MIVVSLVCVFAGDLSSDSSVNDANISKFQLQIMLEKINNCSEEIGIRSKQVNVG